LYADTPAKKQFSQHANTLAVLGDVVAGDGARALLRRALEAKDLAEPGLFFQYYVHAALAKAGEGDTYLDRLDPWREMLARGLTTFAETVDRPNSASRSDCHAWSASPQHRAFPNGAGGRFRRARIPPRLGPAAPRQAAQRCGLGPASQRKHRRPHRVAEHRLRHYHRAAARYIRGFPVAGNGARTNTGQ
jgi:hypothetical protein